MLRRTLAILAFLPIIATANTTENDFLVKLEPGFHSAFHMQSFLPLGSQIDELKVGQWVRVTLPAQDFSLQQLKQTPGVAYVQPNYKIKLLEDYRVKNGALRKELAELMAGSPFPGDGDQDGLVDNPALPTSGSGGSGPDPLVNNQWGMQQTGASQVWGTEKGREDMIVAVIDTGVDYTHEDLVDNLWRNPGEIAGNNVDDDGNGFVDDIIGWDFVSDDNKPYDLKVSIWEMLSGGGNPGHGTHCAGNVAARGDNGKGISGVAPRVKIMSIRFISEKGQGTTADAIAAIKYAVDNGAKVMSNSWGSEGEEAGNPENQALRDIIQYAQNQGVLFVAAAGNGHQGVGYDNDTDSRPAYPASYNHDVIISVAAIDSSGQLGSFSNWGRKTVDIGAPGVRVFSTTVGSNYTDLVIDFFGQKIYWDGTSMATPHVAGAAALYWSKYPTKSWQEVKSAILNSARPNSVLSNRTVSGGQLDVQNLMNQ